MRNQLAAAERKAKKVATATEAGPSGEAAGNAKKKGAGRKGAAAIAAKAAAAESIEADGAEAGSSAVAAAVQLVPSEAGESAPMADAEDANGKPIVDHGCIRLPSLQSVDAPAAVMRSGISFHTVLPLAGMRVACKWLFCTVKAERL